MPLSFLLSATRRFRQHFAIRQLLQFFADYAVILPCHMASHMRHTHATHI